MDIVDRRAQNEEIRLHGKETNPVGDNDGRTWKPPTEPLCGFSTINLACSEHFCVQIQFPMFA